MYFIVSLLCTISSLILVGILRNFGLLNAGTAFFFSLFPLACIIAATLLKRNAMKSGTTSQNKNAFKFGGLIIILVVLGWGGFPPFLELWNEVSEVWMKPALVWYGVLAIVDVLTIAIEFSHEKKDVQLDQLHTNEIG